MIEKQNNVTGKWAEYPAFFVVAMFAGCLCFVISGAPRPEFHKQSLSLQTDTASKPEWQVGLEVKHIFPVREFFPGRQGNRQH